MSAKGRYAGSKGPFSTLGEANAAKPDGAKRWLSLVTSPDGKPHYTWANGPGAA
jgi:hypothetical protein